MKALDELRQDVLDSMRKHEQAKMEQLVAEQKWAEAACPHQVGDIVTVHGYAYHGHKCQILDIFAVRTYAHSAEFPFEWCVSAAILNANGAPGARHTSWRAHEDTHNKKEQQP